MSEPTLYRLPNSDSEHAYAPATNGRCRECFQHPQRCAVPVEPTDRICRTHNYWMDIAETICDVRWMDERQTECDTFDVVRVTEGEQR